MKLPSLVESKLLWKLDQICRYRLWLEEEDSSTSDKYSKFAFDELDSRIGLSTILQYHRSWSENSLGKLKTMFNRMGNRPSASASK